MQRMTALKSNEGILIMPKLGGTTKYNRPDIPFGISGFFLFLLIKENEYD